MSGMADEMERRMREEGDPLATRGTSASGTGDEPDLSGSRSPAGAKNTETRDDGGDPGPIPYSRFAEVNSALREMRERYGLLEEQGIEPDSAVRLANFERAYQQDPAGTISAMVEQLDLPAGRKEALKELLTIGDGAELETSDGDGKGDKLPAEVVKMQEQLAEITREREAAESQQRLDIVVDHWKQLDAADKIVVPERQRLMYIQTAAASGGFQTLEQLAEKARGAYLEDRDDILGGAVQRRDTRVGTTLPVSDGGVRGAEPIVPKSMEEARKLINADIAAGRFPDLTGE